MRGYYDERYEKYFGTDNEEIYEHRIINEHWASLYRDENDECQCAYEAIRFHILETGQSLTRRFPESNTRINLAANEDLVNKIGLSDYDISHLYETCMDSFFLSECDGECGKCKLRDRIVNERRKLPYERHIDIEYDDNALTMLELIDQLMDQLDECEKADICINIDGSLYNIRGIDIFKRSGNGRVELRAVDSYICSVGGGEDSEMPTDGYSEYDEYCEEMMSEDYCSDFDEFDEQQQFDEEVLGLLPLLREDVW